MHKSYLTFLTVVFILHSALIFGAWQLSTDTPLPRRDGAKVITLGLAQETKKVVRQESPKRSQPKLNPTIAQSTPKQDPQEEIAREEVAQALSRVDSARDAELMDLYKAELRQKIDQNKFYPVLSRRMGQTGVVVVAFTLLEDGQIINIRVENPSNFEKLNEAGLAAVKKVNRFRPIPSELGITRMDLKVPVKFVTL